MNARPNLAGILPARRPTSKTQMVIDLQRPGELKLPENSH
jgi:hypothetical protein